MHCSHTFRPKHETIVAFRKKIINVKRLQEQIDEIQLQEDEIITLPNILEEEIEDDLAIPAAIKAKKKQFLIFHYYSLIFYFETYYFVQTICKQFFLPNI